MALAVSLWQGDSTPQMCHPHHQKSCVQPHTLSTGGLQGHSQKCPSQAKGMLCALDPTLLSQSPAVPLGCFLAVGVCSIVPQPHASGRRSTGTHPSTLHPWQWCVVPRSVPQRCTSADTASMGSLGQGEPPGGPPGPQPHPQPQDSTGSQSCPQHQLRGLHGCLQAQSDCRAGSPGQSPVPQPRYWGSPGLSPTPAAQRCSQAQSFQHRGSMSAAPAVFPLPPS